MTNSRPERGRSRSTRRQRRAGAATTTSTAPQGRSAAKVYTTPQPSATANVYAAPAANKPAAKVYATTARRSFIGEPAPVDHSREFRAIRGDLLRILVWASVLIIAMILLAVLPIF